MKSIKKKNGSGLVELLTIFVLLLGALLFIICLQPIDGGPNGGVRGIGGLNALMTAIYVIASGVMLIKLSIQITELEYDLNLQQKQEKNDE